MATIKKMIEVEVTVCDYCGQEITDENDVYDSITNDKVICENCIREERFFYCPECEKYYPWEKGITHWTLGGDIFCPTCVSKIADELLSMVKEVEEGE